MKIIKSVSFALLVTLTLAAGRSGLAAISSLPEPGFWGATNGLVFALVRSGDVVYLGGEFQQLVSPDGTTVINVNGLAAINANTGQPTNWRPAADGTVYALAAAPDGSAIYVGGTFTNIDGVPRSRFAAIAPDGSLLWSADASGAVKAFTVLGNTLFMGGNFTRVLGKLRLRLAAIQPPSLGGTNAVLLGWNPSVIASDGGTPAVLGLVVANGDVAAIGRWTHANGEPEPNQVRFDAITGTAKPWADNVDFPAKGLATDGVNYYGAFAGSNGGRLIAFGPDGNELWRVGGNGDMQAVTVCQGQIIVGGHFTRVLGVDRSRIAAVYPDGVLDTTWTPNPNSGGDRGVWAIHFAEKLYIGGGFLKVGTRVARQFAPFPVDGTPTTPIHLQATRVESTRVDLAWHSSADDVAVTGYEIHRVGILVGSVGSIPIYSDPTVLPLGTYNYQVRARDADGNVSGFGSGISVATPADTQPPGTPTGLIAVVDQFNGVTLSWYATTDNVGVTAYLVYRDGVLLVRNRRGSRRAIIFIKCTHRMLPVT